MDLKKKQVNKQKLNDYWEVGTHLQQINFKRDLGTSTTNGH